MCTEDGIDPSPGCEIHCTPEELASGKDSILDFAIGMLKDKPLPGMSLMTDGSVAGIAVHRRTFYIHSI